MARAQLGYLKGDSPLHRLTGLTKLLTFLCWSLMAMISFDARALALLLSASLVFFAMSGVKFKQVALVFYLVAVMMLLNLVMVFLFSPDEGCRMYGTRTVLIELPGRYSVTAEQLFYELTIALKYLTIIPIALLFILTTQPSEFASSLNAIFVPYSIAYAVAIALRYIPDVQRDYRNISAAQQARGLDMSRDVKALTRLRRSAAIVMPLVFASIDRIGSIANAMELRGFGKGRRRTWYTKRPFGCADAVALGVVAALLGVALALTASNGSRVLNPFV